MLIHESTDHNPITLTLDLLTSFSYTLQILAREPKCYSSYNVHIFASGSLEIIYMGRAETQKHIAALSLIDVIILDHCKCPIKSVCC